MPRYSTDDRSVAGKRIAFAGPSLAGLDDPQRCTRDEHRRWQKLSGQFEFRPPARRGDLLAALAEQPDALVVLDGYYYTVPSIAHKEILFALDQGIRLYGGASFGALRAVECSPWGMSGVGWIVEQYENGNIEGDDEVALLHLDADDEYRAVTIALVDVRYVLAGLDDADPKLSSKAAELIRRLSELPFDERRLSTIQRLADETLGATATAQLLGQLETTSIKRLDALATLERALEDTSRPKQREQKSPSLDDRNAEPTVFLGSFLERHVTALSTESGRKLPIDLAWRAARILHPQTADLVARVRRRYDLARAACGEDPELSATEIDQKLDELNDRPGARWLPPTELRAEARLRLLAEAGETLWSSESRSAEMSADLIEDPPGWIIQRAFALSPAFEKALSLALACDDVFQAFEAWTRNDQKITRRALDRLAADLWRCEHRDLPNASRARGLSQTTGLSPGLYEALAWLAPAERLGRSINEYPTLREALRQTPLI